MMTECVYCAVRTHSLNMMQVSFRLSRVNLSVMFSVLTCLICMATNTVLKQSHFMQFEERDQGLYPYKTSEEISDIND
jgi:hypothetical protein